MRHARYLESIQRAELDRARADEHIRTLIRRARTEPRTPVPWSAIGEALGVSKQAVQRKYGTTPRTTNDPHP